MVSLLKRTASGTSNAEYFVRYVTIGTVAVIADLTCFQTLVLLRVFLPITTTIAFACGVLVHFTLNKLWTFRVKGAPHAFQIAAYLTVLSASFLVTQLVVETMVLGFHAVPIVARIVAVIVQLPVGFFGHRYITFRDGRCDGVASGSLAGDIGKPRP
jgi:putative flippase GtrA